MKIHVCVSCLEDLSDVESTTDSESDSDVDSIYCPTSKRSLGRTADRKAPVQSKVSSIGMLGCVLVMEPPCTEVKTAVGFAQGN